MGRIAHACRLALVVAATAPLLAQAQPPRTGRPLAIEDYYRIQTVEGPQISPGGRWVAFSIGTRIEEDNSTRTEVHVVPTDASAPSRRVLHYGRDVSNPAWTRDDRLEYTVDRQRWRIDPTRPFAAPVPAADLSDGAIASPDGQWFVVMKEKPVARTPLGSTSAFEKRHDERFKGVIFDWKDFQRDGAPFPAPNLRARPALQVVVQRAGGTDAKVLVDEDLRPVGLVWHPDGQRLAFVADPQWRDELRYESPDLFTVTLDGRLVRLTDDDYVHEDPGFSPDGKYLSYVRSLGTDLIIRQKLHHGGPRDLYVRPLGGGDAINLTAGWDLEPDDPRWSPDGRFIYFTATTGGEVQLFRAWVPSGRVDQVTKGPRRLMGLTIDAAAATMAYTLGVHNRPPEVFAARTDGTGERQLTRVHDAMAAEVAFSQVERLRWSSRDGTPIEGWLMFPHAYDPSRHYPLIVTSHGGPHAATGYAFEFKKQFFAANGYFVLDSNFRSSTGYGDAFKWATWGEWGRKDGEDVVAGVEYVTSRYPIDPRRVGHTGHSYGGFLTNWLITQYPETFAAAITGAGISNWVSDYGTADIYRTKETEFFGTPWDAEARDRMIRQSPLTHAGRVKTPTLFVHGEVDQRVPYEEGEQMYFALKRRGVPAKMIQYAGQPHGIAGHWNNVHRMLNELRWWDTYLKPAADRATASAQR